MHPLLDRHDIRRQRDQQPDAPDGSLGALAAELAHGNHLLERLLTANRVDVAHLCVTDRDPAQAIMENFPAPGARRFIVRRPGNGGTFTVPAATPTLILPAAEARLGGQIVNTGANPVTLALAADLLQPGTGSPLAASAPAIWLAGVGGAWDMRLSGLLWCGTVIAVSPAGTTVTAAEV